MNATADTVSRQGRAETQENCVVPFSPGLNPGEVTYNIAPLLLPEEGSRCDAAAMCAGDRERERRALCLC
eukprot:5037626-Amphidinium_carterae.2